jgi:hypothetical protein
VLVDQNSVVFSQYPFHLVPMELFSFAQHVVSMYALLICFDYFVTTNLYQSSTRFDVAGNVVTHLVTLFTM